jgi:hypothetical protein
MCRCWNFGNNVAAALLNELSFDLWLFTRIAFAAFEQNAISSESLPKLEATNRVAARVR